MLNFMIEFIKIPGQRKSVLIGRDGNIKKEIESRTGTTISISLDSCEVEIRGDDPEKVRIARDIVTAIGRGFTPKRAMRILNKNCCFEIISLRHETRNTVKRLMARVIGRNGSVKRKIEKSTGARLCIFGKTVSFIGTYEENRAARKLVKMLLEGKLHAKVFAVMQQK